jgi:hypothetical protein
VCDTSMRKIMTQALIAYLQLPAWSSHGCARRHHGRSAAMVAYWKV